MDKITQIARKLDNIKLADIDDSFETLKRTVRLLEEGLIGWIKDYRETKSYGNDNLASQIRGDIMTEMRINRLDEDIILKLMDEE